MPAEKKSAAIASLENDVRSLESKIDLIIQKVKTSEKNEDVIGRTVVTLNNKLKKLEEGGLQGSAGGGTAQPSEDLEKKFVTKEELKELKYTVDMINPLEFVTRDQVKELIEESKKKG